MRWKCINPLLVIGVLACGHDPLSASRNPSVQRVAAEAGADSLRAVGGRAFIGIKEADQKRGVDEQGRTLTSAQTSASVKRYLIDLGITFEYEYQLIPTVASRIPLTGDVATLLTRLRTHPNIDYVEPIFPGNRFGTP